MDVKRKVLLQLFNKRKLRNGNKTDLERIFFSVCVVKFKKLGFSAPLTYLNFAVLVGLDMDIFFLRNRSCP